ncbi:MAG: endolytic transglycosylase MltG [Oscillospiraceae bacterium]|nr:endolytic transglycosylase MltG [Oscillospiraceae bacterium]
MPNHNVDDELEEIRRLIADPAPGKSSASKELVPPRPGQVVPVSQKNPGTPAPTRRPAPPPNLAQKSASPVPTKKSAPPLPAKRPAAPLPAREAAPPVPVKKAVPPPVLPKKPPASVSPSISDSTEVRSFDISSGGKISKHQDISTSKELDIAPNGKMVSPRNDAKVIDLDTGDDDFKVNFDFDGEYKDVPEDRPLRRRRERRTGCIGGIMYAAFIICISLVLASLLWMAVVDVLGFGTADEQVNITIPPNFEMSDVTDQLYSAGLIRYRFLFNMYASFSNAEERITEGAFVLNKNFDYRALVQGMTARAGQRVETTVTIPEGFTLLQIFNLLDDYGIVHSADDLWEAATYHDFDFHFLDSETLGERYRLEGFLFPNTYNFFLASSPTTVLNRLLREFDRRFTEDMIARAEEMGFSVREIVIIASMIERETGSHNESPRIAAVIYNRLASPNFPFLQIDATISYAVQGTGLPATTDLDHPFNTYLHPGLPPGPIANPGIQSIRAALHPLNTNEFFYALNLEGTHNFFRTYAEHNAFVQSDQFGAWWR